TAVCPSSSVTSTAVSWSMVWVMVAMTPILNSALTTSPPFMASFWARSATVMASPMATSRTTGAVGRVKPLPVRAWSRCCPRCGRFGRAAPRRARSAGERCSWPAKRAALPSPSTPATMACEPRCFLPAPRSSRAGAGFGWPWPWALRGDASSTAAAAAASVSARRRSASASSARRRASSASSARRRSASARRCCSSRLRWRDSSSLRRISARSSSSLTAPPPAAADLSRVIFLRTTTSTVGLLRPPPTVSVLLRCRVIFLGATGASAPFSVRPWVRRRKPRSFTFSVLVTTWSGSLNCMPASDSCSSSFSTGVFTSAASLRMVVCCDIRIPVPLASARAALWMDQFWGLAVLGGRDGPGLSALAFQAGDLARARGQHQGRGARLVEALDAEFQHLVGGQVGQVLGGAYAVAGEREGGFVIHALERQQVVGRHVVAKLLLDRQRIVEQGVAGAGAQLLDDVLVETFDREQLAHGHVGDLLDRAEALGHQDAGDFLVDLELLLEQRARRGLLGLGLRGDL